MDHLKITQFRPHVRVVANPGSGIRTLYAPVIGDNGSMELEEKGTEDLYQSIQSHRDSVDIHVLLSRYSNGEVDVLTKVQGVYGDFTQMPKTYAELLNQVIAGEHMFNGLPVEIRAKFDHDFNKFMVQAGSPEFFEKLGINLSPDSAPDPVPDPVPEGGAAE